MATLPTQVRPGDVITSELMNAILDAIGKLQGTPTGTQQVPSVFGGTLGDARSAILQPGRQLALGFVLDVSGASIDPLVAANAGLIVLNQAPAGGTLVAPGTPVSLVVSRAAGSTAPPPAPPSPPTITRTETPTGTATSSFAVGASLVVVGLNFSATASQNTVTFNDVPAASVSVDVGDATRRLIVTVPSNIPGAPTSSGGAPLAGVVLRVATPNTTPATTTVTITAPVPAQPTIIGVSSALVLENTDITITGTNFTQSASVIFRVGNNTPVTATVSSRTSTQIVARVPNFPEILPGPPTAVTLMVSVPNPANPQQPLVATFQGSFNVVGASTQ